MMRKIYVLVVVLLFAKTAFSQTDSSNTYELKQEVVVTAIRANTNTPITQYTISRKQLEEKYYGADIPTLINFTPSVNSYSDNGTGIGYSTFRLRGMDITRINFTVNGIPVNDPEVQGVFFNNFADLATSAENIQIQRGVGTTTNGSAAYGGSVNLLSKNLSTKPEFNIHAGYGSYNSRRMSVEYQTGLIDNKFAFYGRISEVGTDGYRNHSGSVIRSYFASAAYFGKKSVLKLNAFGGSSESQLAYNGIDKPTMDLDRTTSPFTNNERDAFKQKFFQLQYSYNLNKHANVVASAYYVTGNAPRFEYSAYSTASYPYTYSSMNMPNAIVGNDTLTSSDFLVNYKLNQQFFGGFINYNYKLNRVELNAGIHANGFQSDHYMEVAWARNAPASVEPNHQVYFNTGYKNEASAFIKLNYHITDALSVFADAQMRAVSFHYNAKVLDIRKDNSKVDDMNWTFFNPKLGVRYILNDKTAFYGMAGRTSREPTRSDYFQDDFATNPVTKQSDVKYETVNDFEFGTNFKSKKIILNANVFAMEFENQIVNTGQINAVAYYITTNVKASYRRGIELDFLWKINKYVWLMNSSSFSKNKATEITQHYSLPDYSDTAITYKNSSLALSPELIINQGIRIIPMSWLYIEANYRYVSMQYLDNSTDKNISLPEFNLIDARIGINLSKWFSYGIPTISIQCNNITNEKYSPSGSTTPFSNTISYDANGKAINGTSSLYFPAATRNVFVTLNWKF